VTRIITVLSCCSAVSELLVVVERALYRKGRRFSLKDNREWKVLNNVNPQQRLQPNYMNFPEAAHKKRRQINIFIVELSQTKLFSAR
jgi:hypothetical protein